jgi:hypothetical protein
MVMMAMAVATAMVMVMVPEALRQVGWLRQRQRLKASTDLEPPIGQSFHKLRVFLRSKAFPWVLLSLKRSSLKRGSLKRGFLKQALK